MDKKILEVFSDDILDDIASLYGVSSKDFKKLSELVNLIYEFSKHGRDYIIRVSHSTQRSLNQIASSLDWIMYLKEHGISVSVPVRSQSGRLVEEVNDLNGDDSFYAVVFEKASGGHLHYNNWDNNFFQEWGEVVGKMHTLTKDYKPSAGISRRKSWHQEKYIESMQNLLTGEDEILIEKGKDIIGFLMSLHKDRDSFGLIHSDIHSGNFFVDDNNFTLFDFDDCEYHWFIQDIAISLFYALWCPIAKKAPISFAENFFTQFMMGYSRSNHLEFHWFDKLHYFLKLRELILYLMMKEELTLHEENNWTDWMQKEVVRYRYNIANDIPYIECNFSDIVEHMFVRS